MADSNKGLRILIIEDDSDDQCLLTALLEASVIKIQLHHTAETLAKAIDCLQKETFDIIFLDLFLPGSSGIDTFKTIKEHAGKIPVIILSGLTDMNVAMEAISLGAQDYHIKGELDEKALTKTILYSIERVKAEKDLSNERNLLRALIDHLPDYIYVKDTSFNYSISNRAFVKLVGAASEAENIHKNSIDLFGEEIGQTNMTEDKRIIETGETIIDRDEPIITNEGKKLWLLTTKVPLKDQEGKVIGILGISKDITERKEAEQELEESYKAIRKLTEHLQNIREKERVHIAREIHDELGQQLTVLKMDISWIIKKIGIQEEPVKARMKELLVMLDETVKSVRRISSELRPSLLDDLGLTAAMEWQLTEFEKRFAIKTHFKPHDAEIKLSESVKIALFRIFQESLTNVARHSKATKVTVTLLIENGSVFLSVDDNGVGFEIQKKIGTGTLGILGMQERTSMMGGTYEINGNPGEGTRVVVTIPLIDRGKS